MKFSYTQIIKQLLGVVITGLFLSSCNVAYIPSLHNIPNLKKEKEFQVNITPANFQGAYAINNNFAAMLNAQLGGLGGNTTVDDETYTHKRSFIEGGFGYYKLREENTLFQVYAGAAYGGISFKNSTVYEDQQYKARATKLFVQPSVSILSEYFTMDVALKVMNMKFFDVDTSNYFIADLKDDKLYNLDRNPFQFAEPSITFKAGTKHAKAFLQFVYSYKLNTEAIRYYDKYIFAGLTFNF